MRIEFPSDGYLNALNSTLAFDLSLNLTPVACASLAAGSTANVITFTEISEAAVGDVVVVYNDNGTTSVYMVSKLSSATGTSTATLDRNLDRALDASDSSALLFRQIKLQQGGAHNLISRVRVLYASMVIEDIQ